MENRLARLEDFNHDTRERFAGLEIRLEQIPTLGDLHREIWQQTWRLMWFFSACSSALVAATYFLTKHTT